MRSRSVLALAALLLAPASRAAIADHGDRRASSSSWLRGFFGFGGSGGDEGGQKVLGHGDDGDGHPTFTPSQLPSIVQHSTAYVAFGDSYSAGIGTGFEGKEDDCRLGVGAYPWLIYGDLLAASAKAASARGISPNASAAVAFQWLSCTGSTTDELLAGGAESQIDDFNATAFASRPGLFATLSVGGNDLGFFDVINACVFRFYGFYSGTCEAALAKADAALASPLFEQRLVVALLQILDRAQWEKRPRFAVTVTGYARFFNAETDLCETCSMGMWWGGGGPLLTRDLRGRMNALVAAANAKLRDGIAAVNARFVRPKVFFVDYDEEFEGHRFCEPGVLEPDYAREDTWFFHVGGVDNGQNGTAPPPNSTFPNATLSTGEGGSSPGGFLHAEETLPPLSPLVDPETCLGPARRRGDWGELALCYMAMARQEDPSLRPARGGGPGGPGGPGEPGEPGGVWAENSMWYVPTYYGKTFHPRSNGHKVMRKKIYELWEREGL